VGLAAIFALLTLHAETGDRPMPPETWCQLVLICHEQPPAPIQLSPWLGVGGGWREGHGGLLSLSVGLDGTFAVTSFPQPPGGDNGGRVSLRLGPFLAFESPLDRWSGEGGLSLALRQERFEAWGSLNLRVGGGVDDLRHGYAVGVVAWGIYGERRVEHCGGCGHPTPPYREPTFAITEGLRLYAALRRGPSVPAEWTFGIELQPTWLLPPYDREKWLGYH
jgi:hypothetical protein